ncbi:MAG: hypothetical protein R3E51_16135 [Rhizobiaceae bacterium]
MCRRPEILPYLERLRDDARVPIVYVSHSVTEVARLATDIVMLSAGRVGARFRARYAGQGSSTCCPTRSAARVAR